MAKYKAVNPEKTGSKNDERTFKSTFINHHEEEHEPSLVINDSLILQKQSSLAQIDWKSEYSTVGVTHNFHTASRLL